MLCTGTDVYFMYPTYIQQWYYNQFGLAELQEQSSGKECAMAMSASLPIRPRIQFVRYHLK